MTKKTTEDKTTNPVDEKVVAVVEKRLTKAESYATDLVIKSDEDERKATIALSELNKLGDEITGQKEETNKTTKQSISVY